MEQEGREISNLLAICVFLASNKSNQRFVQPLSPEGDVHEDSHSIKTFWSSRHKQLVPVERNVGLLVPAQCLIAALVQIISHLEPRQEQE